MRYLLDGQPLVAQQARGDGLEDALFDLTIRRAFDGQLPTKRTAARFEGACCALEAGGISGKLQGRVPSLDGELGGLDDFIDSAQVGDSLHPCIGDEYTKPAMATKEQVELTASAVVSFFDAHLAESAATRAGGCRYLLHEVTKHPAVTLGDLARSRTTACCAPRHAHARPYLLSSSLRSSATSSPTNTPPWSSVLFQLRP